ncbi:P-loop NTPase fold protein [Enterobacter bugandensis]|uniref:KAP family P-loop NTPase fold protein n=1 Tax=Enterobacter bugandensis TaxID=881260 RepID=UPI002664E50D|nr:P-loop NTPase fold protein [Enterobacter bugandensis]MDO2431285.1 P-loop NTPase fold protein [Enterobacter bugandensis]MDO2443951.1 P-loop NTPase fold protein [Enterobacter bugandensis]
MNIAWKWDNDDEFFGEKLPPDTLDRKKYARYLYEICSARGNSSNLVININAEWGAGKTYFTKRLAKTITNKHPTIYIDAWKEDFSDDPLLTVFSSIKSQLTGQSDKFTTIINKTIDNIGPLLKTATPVIIDSLIKKITGIDSASDLTKDLSAQLLELHAEKASKIETIRKGIDKWVKFIEHKDYIEKDLPIFIIIDELDRCRPSFAINLLEIVKHIFNIPGVVFIIATDTEQLQHSIKVVYGNDFSASHYLSRFFDRRFLLPSPNLNDLLLTKTGDNIVGQFASVEVICTPCAPNFTSFISNCASILQSFKVNLRDSIKIYERLIDIIITSSKKFDPNLMLILLSLNFKSSEIYSKIKQGDNIDPSYNLYLIELSFNLSYNITRVRTLKSLENSYVSNSNENYQQLNCDAISYVKKSREVLSEANSRMSGNRQINITEGWLNGDINVERSLINFLKMSYAHAKLSDSELKFRHYFDLIELSTTFE